MTFEWKHPNYYKELKMKSFKQVEEIDAICEQQYKDLPITEAEYQGKKVKLNDPIRGGSKKFYVYVKDGDKVKKVSFGDTTGLEQDIIVIIQDLKPKQDTGLVINGVQMHQ
jgi:hypothetical protein